MLVAAAAACVDQPRATSGGYTFHADIDPETSTVTVNGSNLVTVDATFASYAEAEEQLHLDVHIAEGAMSNDIVLRPGYCDETATRLGLDLGEMLVEDVTLVVTSGLFLHAREAYCQGTLDGFQQGS
jgi:hypothetical protein